MLTRIEVLLFTKQLSLLRELKFKYKDTDLYKVNIIEAQIKDLKSVLEQSL